MVSNICFSQHQERKVFTYNILLGGFSSGIGGIINTDKGGDWKKNFLNSFWQGSIGGALHYSGKKTTYLIYKNNSLLAAWPAKIQHAAGSSIIENAALNRPFLKNWNIDFGPVRFDYSITDKKFRARFLPVSIYTCIEGLGSGDLDLKTTLATGTFVFKTQDYSSRDNLGLSYGRGFSYIKDVNRYHVIAHEIIHTFQFSEFQFFNSWLTPLSNKVRSNKLKLVFNKYVYFDIPYFNLFYALEGQHSYFYYYRNFFEFEAERFATNAYVPVN